MPTTPPPKTPKPQPPSAPPSRSPAPTAPAVVRSVRRGNRTIGQKIGIYGSGGIGKSKLWSLAEKIGVLPLGIDIEASCGFLDAPVVDPAPATWDDLLATLRDHKLLEPYGLIAIDSFTRAQEMAAAWTIANIKHERGYAVTSIEGYGFGKGYIHIYETFLQLLACLDAIARRGTHIVFTCHDCTAPVPNPAGEDYIRYEPRLQAPASGKASIRHRVKEWCDHLIFVGYDTHVGEDGKASGSGTRTIYTTELPTHWAKSRLLNTSFEYEDGNPKLWTLLFGEST